MLQGEVVVRRKLTRGRVLVFFEKLPPMSGRDRGLQLLAPLGARADRTRPRGEADAGAVREALRQAQKNDAADAEAICEAVTRPTMRFVPVKTPEQQSVMMLHRVRLMLYRQRTQLSNALRAHLSEFGIVAPIGRGDRATACRHHRRERRRIPAGARLCLQMLVAQLAVVKARSSRTTAGSWRCARDRARPAADGGPRRRPAARQCTRGHRRRSARLPVGARPGGVDRPGSRQNSSGGKERLGSISKAGHRYLRQMLVVGSMAVIRYAERTARRPWLVQLMARRTAKVAAVALANKIARIVWAMMTSGERYRGAGLRIERDKASER